MTKKEFNKKIKGMTTFDSLHRKWMKKPAYKKAYLDSQPEFDLTVRLIEKRIKEGLTQKQLAKKLGTKQSAISRFESGNGNPTLLFLRNLATALDTELKVGLVKRKQSIVV
jgi:ribosome-binding protein aMBF1 (putative translation factor)